MLNSSGVSLLTCQDKTAKHPFAIRRVEISVLRNCFRMHWYKEIS
jgi:hypothetical protein